MITYWDHFLFLFPWSQHNSFCNLLWCPGIHEFIRLCWIFSTDNWKIFDFNFKRTLISYVHSIALTFGLIILLIITIYRHRRAAKSNKLINSQINDEYFTTANTATKFHVLLQSSIQNSNMHSKSFNQFRQFRKSLQTDYVVSICKLILKLFVVVFVVENYFLNFVRNFFYFNHISNSNQFWLTEYYCHKYRLIRVTAICILKTMPMNSFGLKFTVKRSHSACHYLSYYHLYVHRLPSIQHIGSSNSFF